MISAVFSDAGAVAGVGSLLMAYRAWRDTRTQAPAFMIEKDGVTVVMHQGSEQEIRYVLGVMFPDPALRASRDGRGGSWRALMAMVLPDPEKSRVVLVGVPEYAELLMFQRWGIISGASGAADRFRPVGTSGRQLHDNRGRRRPADGPPGDPRCG